MNSDIFNIAKALFCEKGYSKTKIGDITGKLGLVPANFYRHYDSKEELLKEIIIEETSDYIKELKSFESKENFHEKIKLIFEVNLKFLFEKTHLFALLMEIKNANYKLDRSTINLANAINNITKDSLSSILDHSTLDNFTRTVAHKVLIDDLNIFLENLIKDSDGHICPTKLLTINFDEEFNNLFKLTKSICYGLGVSSSAFSKLDKTTGVLREDFFLELLTKTYNCITPHKSSFDILYLTVSGYSKLENDFFTQNIFQSIGFWLKNSFRDADQAGLIGGNNFALLLSKHSHSSSPLLLKRCLEFEILLQEKYPTLTELKLDAKLLSVEEGHTIDFKAFFHSEEAIEKHAFNKTNSIKIL